MSKATRTKVVGGLLCVACLIVLLCCYKALDRPKTPEDFWYRGIADGDFPPNAYLVNQSKVAEITPSQKVTAERMLQKKPVVQLSPTQAVKLAAKRMSLAKGENYYLVRGVDPAGGGGEVRLYHHGQKLWVTSSFLGSGSMQITRRPLIVILTTFPHDVFVTCSMAS